VTNAVEIDLVALANMVLIGVAAWIAGSAAVADGTARRLGVGLSIIVAVAAAFMLQHVAGLSLLAHPWPLRMGFAVALGGALVFGHPSLPGRHSTRAIVIVVAAATMIALQALIRPETHPVGDMLLHQGWIHQLADGRPSPGGVYAGVPNSYPWLYHALAALVLQALPGDLAATLITMELLMLAALAIGVWLLAEQLQFPATARTWSCSLAIIGGGLTLKDSPAPTLAIGNIPPPLPREFGFALGSIALWSAVLASRTNRRLPAICAGTVSGLVFLTAPLAGLIASATGIVMIARRHVPNAVLMMLATSAVSAIWLVPLAGQYRELGGFRRITTIHAHESTVQLVAALGPLIVVGGVGLIRSSRSLPADSRWNLWAIATVPVAFTAVAAVVSSSAPLGAPALTRPVRYLPAVGLALALAGGLGASSIVAGFRQRRTFATFAVAICTAALPLWVAMRATVDPPQATALECGAPLPFTAGDTVAVLPRSSLDSVDGVARTVFAATGATALYRTDPRIRFRSIYQRIPDQRQRLAWTRSIMNGGPSPPGVQWIIAPAGATTGRPTVRCEFGGHQYLIFSR
jgi:hypothetical protein